MIRQLCREADRQEAVRRATHRLVNSAAIEDANQCFTLLGVRPDGVASVVDLVAAADLTTARRQATALLAEHRSCSLVEVWRGGALVEQLSR
jgi:hypothetical protein